MHALMASVASLFYKHTPLVLACDLIFSRAFTSRIATIIRNYLHLLSDHVR